MAEGAIQRLYSVPCPGCGAPVEFRSAQSTHAVCAYCQSTVVRQGETLTRIGKMAELFDDFSPLQLMASGLFGQRRFTLVGRLQYQYPEGRWTEWNAALDDGTVAVLSEDNGAYVFSRPADASVAAAALPAAEHFRVGATTAVGGKAYTVTSNQTVSLCSAQGELGHLPALGTPFAMVELRSDDGEVLSIDYGAAVPAASTGRAVSLEELKLSGLRDTSTKQDTGRQFNCPNCGAPVTVQLGSSKSIACPACHSLIDLSQGIGGELAHALQDEPVAPLIALGSLGQLQGVSWQVVGFQHRMGYTPQDPDEHFGWSEYLLYNRQRGFAFLVDSEEGWSLVKPTTGAPKMSPGNTQQATYLGTRYQLKESYYAETAYVAGEFYWQVTRGQKTSNRDFASGRNLLSSEQSANELTWSAGSLIASDAVAAAFKIEGKKDLFQRSDASPVSRSGGVGCITVILVVVVILVLLALMSRCTSCDPRVENCSTSSSSRSSGGSFGGFSSGGGHK
ncbi:hypothetical protein RD110_26530 [Rhodoferax koreense]|uniref:DUF4178 domain-containing protein n=1 Tax=Rhodoferax koreensis TaxID=1842727 RepID=A0A1P8K2V1_9BURK|nr:DUF4178 domain-containing protein [Rhodoferax koreense]APW40317.1 hypothetical protein RD110_26530 [Rhodoferax koreense]